MLLVETQPTSTAPAFDAVSNFRLKIRTDETSQQLVELRQGKTTIGSSPRCDIRIKQPGVQPLHCLLICDGGGLSVRRWAAGTRLNDQPFDEAPFGPGDRLSVGQVELELENVRSGFTAENSKNSSERAAPGDVEASSSPADATRLESWGEWSSTRLTDLSEQRHNDAPPLSSGDNSLAPEHSAAWPDLWGPPQGGAELAEGSLTVFHEQLLKLEEKLASWKDAREDWRQERAEWRAEREQAQQQRDELERQIAILQVRATEIVGRIERLEHSMAAQALIPKFEPPHVELRFSEPLKESFVAPPAAKEPASTSFSSLEEPATPEVDVVAEPQPETEDELAPFAEFSIWGQGAVSPTSASDESDVADYSTAPSEKLAPQPTTGPALSPGENAWQIVPAKSFIEQYGYIFMDDEASADDASVAPNSADSRGIADSDSIIRKPQKLGSGQPVDNVPSASTGEEEESIEQYMSKLMQRVRGDRPGESITPSAGASTQSPVSAMSPGFLPSGAYSSAPATSQPIVTTGDHPRVGATGDWLTTSLGTVRRKAPIVEQPADLEALRAVANESARRAISKHGLRLHRRNATTKVIVSTLAGMTSLWMMLAAPHWQDLQFITACVSLIVAAYWAGQTYAELIDAYRAAGYVGPEDKLQGFANPLPIAPPADVQKSAKS